MNMKKLKLLLTLLTLCTTTIVWADDVKIPTTDGNPFDLTKGTVTSSNSREKFTENGVEYMYNDDLLEYTLQNEQDADIYNFYVEAANGTGTATLDLSLKRADGTTVADTTFAIAQNGWSNYSMYSMRIRAMKKGKYTLTFTFHQLTNTSWNAVNIKSISFKKPLSLKPAMTWKWRTLSSMTD